MHVPARLITTCLWQWLSGLGLERFSLSGESDEWLLTGTIVTAHQGTPAEVRYRIRCDRDWRTQGAGIDLVFGSTTRELTITVENGRWYANDSEVAAVRGCVDIDLGWSPSTNLLPIRRLNLGVSKDSGVITAAWIKFPELTIEPLPQRYEHLTPELFRYSSNNGTFVADINVDSQGLPIEYAGFWRRVQ